MKKSFFYHSHQQGTDNEVKYILVPHSYMAAVCMYDLSANHGLVAAVAWVPIPPRFPRYQQSISSNAHARTKRGCLVNF